MFSSPATAYVVKSTKSLQGYAVVDLCKDNCLSGKIRSLRANYLTHACPYTKNPGNILKIFLFKLLWQISNPVKKSPNFAYPIIAIVAFFKGNFWKLVSVCDSERQNTLGFRFTTRMQCERNLLIQEMYNVLNYKVELLYLSFEQGRAATAW